MIVQIETVLEAVTRVLLAHPTASMTDIARAAGMARSTLHARYPSRHALVVAMAHDAMDRVERAYDSTGVNGDGPFETVVGSLAAELIPLGGRVELLYRERSLDDDAGVVTREQRIDAPLIRYVERARDRGEISASVAPYWVASVILGTVFTAWEAVTDGALAPREAPALVTSTLLNGFGSR